MAKILFISLIVPAYKQEKTISRNIQSLNATLKKLPYNYEIIVVIDGFIDKTYQIARKRKNSNIKIIGYKQNRGKGYAVRFGVKEAKGDIIGFIDAGMDIEPSEISLMIDTMLWSKADIVIGSKLHPDSQVNYPKWRHFISWGYRTLLYVLFDLNIRDTQVGLKIFKRNVARDVFPRILVKHFAFDVEVLAVATALGYDKIYETPIRLNFQGTGSISAKNLWRIIMHMLWDTFAVYYRLKIIQYYAGKRPKFT